MHNSPHSINDKHLSVVVGFIFLLLFFSSRSLKAQAFQSFTSPLIASVWCGVSSSEQNSPGCDAGLGISLTTYHKFSFVSVVGTKTIGLGLAYTAYTPTEQFPHYIAIAFGVITSYDKGGIKTKIHPALGTTITLGKKQ